MHDWDMRGVSTATLNRHASPNHHVIALWPASRDCEHAIPAHAAVVKAAACCRLPLLVAPCRWHNQLNPDVNKTPFNEWEQAVIVEASSIVRSTGF